jgi:hypothetical protein
MTDDKKRSSVTRAKNKIDDACFGMLRFLKDCPATSSNHLDNRIAAFYSPSNVT